MPLRDLVMVGAVGIMLPMIFIRPHVGMILWAWTAMLVPNSFLYGFASSFRFNLIFAICTLVAWLISKESKKIPLNSTNLLLFFFLFWVCLATSIGVADFDTRLVEITNFVKIIIFAVVVSALATTRLRIYSLLLGIALGMGYHGVAEGAKFIVSGGRHQVFGPARSIIGDNNHFALAMIFLLPLIYYLYTFSEKKIIRMGFLVAGALIFVSVIGTHSRGGLIGLAAVGAYSVFKTRYKIPVLIAICLGLAFIVNFAPEHWFARMSTIQEADQDGSFMGRVVAWKISILLALENPILGGGITAITHAETWHYYARNFASLDFIPTGPPEKVKAAHSVYFQLMADVGFVGLGIFLLILFRAWRSCTTLIRQTKNIPELDWINHLARAFQLSFVAYIVCGAALNMAYFEMFYVFIVLVAIQEKLVQKHLEATAPKEPLAPVPGRAGRNMGVSGGQARTRLR